MYKIHNCHYLNNEPFTKVYYKIIAIITSNNKLCFLIDKGIIFTFRYLLVPLSVMYLHNIISVVITQ